MKRAHAALSALLVIATLGAFGTSHAARRHKRPRLANRDPAPSASPSPSPAIEALDRRLAELEAEEQAARQELSQVGAELAEAHAGVVARGRSFYKLTRAGLLPIGGGFDAFVRHAMNVSHARRGLANDLAHEARLRGRGAELSRALERIAAERASVSAERATLDAELARQREEQRRQAAFDDAFEPRSGGYVAVYGDGREDGDERPDVREPVGPRGFRRARGRLLFPVVGRAQVRPGKREGTDGPGLEIRTAPDTPVRAVFAGRVAFADRYAAYGNLVILDHGDHYYSVSGNLGSIEVKVGEELEAGDRLGTVGEDDEGPLLYFEIRHGSKTVPPGPWLGLAP